MTVLQRINIFFLMITLLIACKQEVTVPYYHTADFTPYWQGESDFSMDTFHTIAPFKFVNQEGQPVTNKTFKGNIYVADFFFTICPGICPKLTGNLTKVSQAFGANDNVMFISHSVTPDIDSVQQLKKYALEHNIDASQWHLVTGDRNEIYKLARESYFAERQIGFQNSGNEFLHTEHFILVDGAGHIRGIYNGTLDLETDRLIDDIKALLVD
jgi:protein SCO1/2